MKVSENSNVCKKVLIVKEKLCVCHTSGIMNPPLIRARSLVIVVTKLSHFLQKSFTTMMMTMKTTFKCPFLSKF